MAGHGATGAERGNGDGKADYLVVYDGGAVRAWLNRGGNTGPG
jgi:hypothetical protein